MTFRRRGGAIPLVLGVCLIMAGILFVLHILRGDRLGRLRQKLQERRADLLARSALSHTLHKVQRCLVRIDELVDLAGGDGVSVDVGQSDPAFVEGLTTPAIPFDKGRSVGRYKVAGLRVRRHRSGRRPAYTLKVHVEGWIESRPASPARSFRKRVEKELYLEGRDGQ